VFEKKLCYSDENEWTSERKRLELKEWDEREDANMKLVYDSPAKRWGEALPLGNGQIGAMYYGGWETTILDLTENTFFSGSSDENNQPGADLAFERMREQASRGRYDLVHKTAESFIGRRKNYGTNLPVGNLKICYKNSGLCGKLPEFYERGVDISLGMAWSERKDAKIREEIRISHPDKVLLMRIDSEEEKTFCLSFVPYHGKGGCTDVPHGFSFSADALEKIHCDEEAGVHLEGSCLVKSNGEISWKEEGLWVEKGTHTEIYLAMETDFDQKEVEKKELQWRARMRTLDALEKGLENVIRDQEADMKKLNDGMSLEITGTDSDSGKIPFLFQYGRYLLFCSSREDSKLPAHLQGIWNDDVACRIGWTCDMHLDINTQMNYWPSENTGLSFTALPLFQWILEKLVKKGKDTAQISYGRPGWAAELVSNAWGFAAPYWASPIAPCPTGGVWIATHLWEHYLYTEDEEFLREQAFPVIDGAVDFFRDYVFEEEPGVYGSGPSISPENSFLYEGTSYQISNSCTYEILMIRELFEIYLEAASILQIQNEKVQEVKKKKEGLRPYRILENGCIGEWAHDLPEADPQHRHTSHLLGLFPFAQITPEKTPELCKAARRTIERKLTPPENWEDTGWARSMLMLYEARLGDGEKAYGHIKSMIKHLLEPNQMVYHPPTRGAGAFDHVYELDGNTGLTSCIAEMLVQSHQGVIRLLPALPSAWKSGEVKRFHARGNVEVSLKWKDGKLTEAKLFSQKPRNVRVFYRGVEKEFEIGENPYLITEEMFEKKVECQ
jgi:alpha-L-fucosidase 2